jgi:hypothetical protein
LETRWQSKRDQKDVPKIRDEILVNTPEVDLVPFFIEPLDVIEIGAWPAKAEYFNRCEKSRILSCLSIHSFVRRRAVACMRKS